MLKRMRKYGAFEQFLHDASSFGGLPAYLFLAFLSFFLPDKRPFAGLVIGLVLAYLIIALTRQLFFRERPDGQKYFDWISRLDAGSFPSMHTTRAALLCTLLWPVFEGNISVRIALIAGVIVTVIGRMMLRKHHLPDVFAGIVLGFVIGLLARQIALYVLPALAVLGIA